MKFVSIPTGSFLRERYKVTISKPFEMQITPVTQEQWTMYTGKKPSYFKGESNLPVESVSWDDVQKFIQLLNDKKDGFNYRLPTEAEWEYACRAESTTEYYFGDDEKKLGDYAWYYKNSENSTHSVGQKKPNDFGLYDMYGNVWEWCSDWYGEYTKDNVTDPTGPSKGSDRVVRGGGWGDDASNLRSAIRADFIPSGRISFLGFRLVRTLVSLDPITLVPSSDREGHAKQTKAVSEFKKKYKPTYGELQAFKLGYKKGTI